MNRILSSFTSSEKHLITFVLLLVAGGYGILEWHSHSQAPMVFDAEPIAPAEHFVSSDNVMPKGMDGGGRVDVNVADGKLLETLPGIGPSLAGAILRHRETNGKFQSMDDLDKVPGIGPAMMAKLAALVTFGDSVIRIDKDVASLEEPVVPRALPQSLAPGANRVVPSASAPSATNGFLVNINTAGPDELDKLKGVGPALADRIIKDRQLRGQFNSAGDLVRVKGIGPKILENNRDHITVK